MPRKGASRFRKTELSKTIQVEFGEDSVSSFHSASTEEDLTNYNLEYTHQRSHKKDKRSKSPVRREQNVRESTRSTSQSERNVSHETRNSSRRAPSARDRSSHNDDEPSVSNRNKRTPQKLPTTSRDRSSRYDDEPSVSTRNKRSPQKLPPPNKPSTSKQLTTHRRKDPNPRKTKTAKQRQTALLNDIRRLQSVTSNIIPKLPFSRLIREVIMQYADAQMRITPVALEALQEMAEIYLTHLFEDSYKCTLHRERVTLMVKDMELARYFKGPNDPGNRR